MRTTRSKLMLLPLIPALAFGVVEVASKISMLTSSPTPVVIVEVPVKPIIPVKRIVIEPPPAPLPSPEPLAVEAA